MQNTHYEMLYREESGYWWYKVRRKIIHNLIKQYRLNFGKEIKILDAGCGAGLLLKELEHFDENKDNRKKLWTLMAFMIWYERFMR